MKKSIILPILIFCLLLAHVSMTFGEGLDFKVADSDMSILPENTIKQILKFQEFPPNMPSEISNKYAGLITITCNNGTKFHFKKIVMDYDKLVNTFKSKMTLKDYREFYGAAVGKPPANVGAWLQNTWDLTIYNEKIEKYVFIRVTALFKPSPNTLAEDYRLDAFSILTDLRPTK